MTPDTVLTYNRGVPLQRSYTVINKYNSPDVSIYIDANTGTPYLDYIGYSLLSHISPTTIAQRMTNGHAGITPGHLVHYEEEVLGGYKVFYLLSAAIVLGWLLEDRPVLAKQMQELGAARYLYELAGFFMAPHHIP